MTGEGLLVSIVKIAAAVAIGLPLVMFLAQDALIFFRQPLPEGRRAEVAKRFPAVEELSLAAADGTRIHAWRVKPGGGAPAPLVVYFGGNAEEVSWMLEDIGDPARGETPGVGWLLVDYRGYGASEGSPSEAALTADALAWFDRAAKLPGVDPKRVYAFGRSLGSGVAVTLAAERALAGVILVSPFDSLVEVGKRHYPFLPVRWMLKHRFDSVSRAPRIEAPLLSFVAANDEIIPPEHSKRLYDAWAGPKRWVTLDGAGHNSPGGAKFWPSIRAFLAGR